MELRSIPAIVRMVATTGNLAFVSQLGLQQQGLVKEIPVAGLTISRRLGLARRKGHILSPATQKFVQRLVKSLE